MPQVNYGLVQPFAYAPAFADWLDVATPAAGATASVTVDGRWSLRVLAARLSLTTDATAANRLVTIDYLDARGITRLRNGAALVVTASTTAQTFEFSAHRSGAEWAANTPVFASLAPWILPPGFVVKFNVTNIQTTDALSALSLWVEKFPGQRGSFPLGTVHVDG